MTITQAQIEERARQRAAQEHLHTFKISADLYLVKSRNLNPGSHHMVSLDGDGRLSCDCPGYRYRASCTHVEALRRRLQREQPLTRKAPPPTTAPAARAATPAPVDLDAARAARKAQADQDIRDIWGD